MVGCFSFFRRESRAQPSATRSEGPTAHGSDKAGSEAAHPLAASMYYDACNPPPFTTVSEQHRCCGAIGDKHDHSSLPTYRDSLGHHAVRYAQPSPEDEELNGVLAEVTKTIESEIKALDKELRHLSLDMHDHPEIMWTEHRTHDLFVEYFRKKSGWKVTPKAYGVDTAWQAVFAHKADKESRTIGFQSELDALPGIGHACGHNLIAISGVAAALSVAAVLVKRDVPGTVILLGTPAEEGGGGKINLLRGGAYKKMDACLMVHPAAHSATGAMLAVQPVVVTYTGQTAHAGAAPWEGINALDAAVLAYSNISALRQQIRPTERVHGIIQGKDWAPNVVPGSSTLIYNIRAPSVSALKVLSARVQKCFEAAALATGCKGEYDWQTAYADVHNTLALRSTYTAVMKRRYDLDIPANDFAASTDFGNITYALPSLHAEYAIHLDDPKTQGNHTIGFANAARTHEAHARTIEATLGIAVTGARVLLQKEYRDRIWDDWKKWREGADGP